MTLSMQILYGIYEQYEFNKEEKDILLWRGIDPKTGEFDGKFWRGGSGSLLVACLFLNPLTAHNFKRKAQKQFEKVIVKKVALINGF